MDLVKRLLEATGTPVTRLDAEIAGSAGLVVDLDRRAILVHGQWISPTVTWLRHFSYRTMPAGRGALRTAFASDSWNALADQLALVSAATVTHRDPGLLAQLGAAHDCGIATPRTVVTTEPARAVALLDCRRMVVKALHRHFVEVSPGLLTGIFPEVATRHAVRRMPAGAPIVVQEYVAHDAEFRVYCIDGRVAAAFAIAKARPGQEWLDPTAVTARWIEPPAALAAAAVALAGALGIEFGAFDFLGSRGVVIFLEVNITGDWRWLERKAGATPVTTAVVRMLRSRHRRLVASDPALAAGAAARVNPVTFLSCGVPGSPVDNGESSL